MKLHKLVWDYLVLCTCDTGKLSLSISLYAKVWTALEITTGETYDISEYLDFGFYDLDTYWTNAVFGELTIGRWIVLSHKVSQIMSYWILKASGRPILCMNLQRLAEG